MAQSCWLKTQDGTVGPSKVVLDYFVSHTAIIKTPRHNLFTARRLSVGSSHLSPRNNCCDDRLCWEHVQACENMHHFRLEGLESQPSWCGRKSDISLVRSSDQFLLCAVWCSMSKDSMLFSHLSNHYSTLRVVSKCNTEGFKYCYFNFAQCPSMINKTTFKWINFHSEAHRLII